MNKIKIKFFDLKKEHSNIRKEALRELERLFDSNAFVLGKDVTLFENEFAKKTGAKFAVGVGSGTDALVFSLLAAGVGRGDEVILPAFTFISTALAVIHVGALPVLADVSLETFNIDPASVKRVLTKKTKAIIPVHLFGQCADMIALKNIAKKNKLKIVEDACQAHGSKLHKKFAGALGDIGCFSFYPTKNLGGFGDGGLVTTSNSALAKKIVQYRNLGRLPHDAGMHVDIGWTSRLDAMQAVLLNVKLGKLSEINQKRRHIAKIYNSRLKKTSLILPVESKDSYHVYHQYVLRVPHNKRDSLKKWLASQGIGSAIYYSKLIYEHPVFKKHKPRFSSLKNSRMLCREVLALPIYPGMPTENVKKVCAAIIQFYEKGF